MLSDDYRACGCSSSVVTGPLRIRRLALVRPGARSSILGAWIASRWPCRQPRVRTCCCYLQAIYLWVPYLPLRAAQNLPVADRGAAARSSLPKMSNRAWGGTFSLNWASCMLAPSPCRPLCYRGGDYEVVGGHGRPLIPHNFICGPGTSVGNPRGTCQWRTGSAAQGLAARLKLDAEGKARQQRSPVDENLQV